MPTGYTNDIQKDISFEDFALSCALAFGACIHQRDDSGKFRPKFREGDYTFHLDGLEETKKEIDELESMSEIERIEYGKKVIQKEIDENQEEILKQEVWKSKYTAMLRKVQDWQPPTPEHNQLKVFMADQINSSIQFDCDTSYSTRRIGKLRTEPPLNYFNVALKRATLQLKYHEECIAKEMNRVNEANKWIGALYDSLGVEYEHS